MEIEELRIGNVIRYGRKQGRVYSIDKNGEEGLVIILSGSTFIDRELTNFDSIPLTQEWLARLGFERQLDCLIKNNLAFVDSYGLEHVFIECDDFPIKDGSVKINCKYVHQLQNLYFALIGKELTLKQE